MFQILLLVVSVLLVGCILLQQKNSSLGSMMGGGGDAGEAIAQTRRGADRFLHRATIVLALTFAGIGIYAMIF